jgi:hypothetical protein
MLGEHVRGALPKASKIIFEVQKKKNNEKITRRRKKAFNLQNAFLFFSL